MSKKHRACDTTGESERRKSHLYNLPCITNLINENYHRQLHQNMKCEVVTSRDPKQKI